MRKRSQSLSVRATLLLFAVLVAMCHAAELALVDERAEAVARKAAAFREYEQEFNIQLTAFQSDLRNVSTKGRLFDRLEDLIGKLTGMLPQAVSSLFVNFTVTFCNARRAFWARLSDVRANVSNLLYIIQENFDERIPLSKFSGAGLDFDTSITGLARLLGRLADDMGPFVVEFAKHIQIADNLKLSEAGEKLRNCSRELVSLTTEEAHWRAQVIELNGTVNYFRFLDSSVQPGANFAALQTELNGLRQNLNDAIADIPKKKNQVKEIYEKIWIFTFKARDEVIDNGEAGHSAYMRALEGQIAALESTIANGQQAFQ